MRNTRHHDVRVIVIIIIIIITAPGRVLRNIYAVVDVTAALNEYKYNALNIHLPVQFIIHIPISTRFVTHCCYTRPIPPGADAVSRYYNGVPGAQIHTHYIARYIRRAADVVCACVQGGVRCTRAVILGPCCRRIFSMSLSPSVEC